MQNLPNYFKYKKLRCMCTTRHFATSLVVYTAKSMGLKAIVRYAISMISELVTMVGRKIIKNEAKVTL